MSLNPHDSYPQDLWNLLSPSPRDQCTHAWTHTCIWFPKVFHPFQILQCRNGSSYAALVTFIHKLTPSVQDPPTSSLRHGFTLSRAPTRWTNGWRVGGTGSIGWRGRACPCICNGSRVSKLLWNEDAGEYCCSGKWWFLCRPGVPPQKPSPSSKLHYLLLWKLGKFRFRMVLNDWTGSAGHW